MNYPEGKIRFENYNPMGKYASKTLKTLTFLPNAKYYKSFVKNPSLFHLY